MTTPSNKLVSIIIVTSGANEHALACLESIKSQTCTDYEIIVIANLLADEITEKIRGIYPHVNLFYSKSKLSYCQSLNIGIDMAKGQYILCLNDDVVLSRDFLAEALKGFSAASSVGMVSGKLLRFDRKTIDSTGLFLSFWRTAKERGYLVPDRGQFEKEGFVFGVSGAAAFYLKGMLEEIKEGDEYFDNNFGFFYEDLDIAWRANRKGWRAYYKPAAVCYHLRGGTTRIPGGQGKAFSRRFLSDDLQVDFIKNRYLTMIKNESLCGFLLHLPGIVLYDLIVWLLYFIFKPGIIRMFVSKIKGASVK